MPKRKPYRPSKMSEERLEEWLHIRHRGAMGRVPDARKEKSRRACRDRKLWGE